MPFPISLDTTGSRVKISAAARTRWQKKWRQMPLPSFASHRPDIAAIKRACKPYQSFKNILLIGNGGSRTNAQALSSALASRSNGKRVAFVTSMDPFYHQRLMRTFKPSDTLVMPVSKSGTNVDMLESLSSFWRGYPVLAVTGTGGTLFGLASSLGWSVIEHPDVGGRFAGNTACALPLLHLLDLDITKLDVAVRAAHERFSFSADASSNDALIAAMIGHALEQKGYTEIFAPCYAFDFEGFLPLLTQLVHESYGKNDVGQTFYGDLAPESQHHTNQRFFGGRRNVLGCFIVDDAVLAASRPRVDVPRSCRGISLDGGVLGDLNGLPLGRGVELDFEGTRAHAIHKKIPHIVLHVRDCGYESVGTFLAFAEWFAVYGALIRGVNPFDQPEVEWSKRKTATLIRTR